MSSGRKVKVRIAPSPTGDPHVGTAYIALFNYAFAKKHGGSFVLRIEDTDQARAKASSEAQIVDSLKWVGLTWDEGPDIGGDFGPYRQSERSDIYRKHCQMLIDSGKAYRCYCDAERLDLVRKKKREDGLKPMYDRYCRGFTEEEKQEKYGSAARHVVRLAMPLDGVITFHDELRGPICIEAKELDDQVILKSDGFPTYHLANVVDDHLMEISHVIRAEEWISSTPKHKVLYEAFGWQEPAWVHMPLLRNTDKSKISKRKNPVSLDYYKRAGFLPEALLNYLGTMGWSFGEDREVFSLTEMVDNFDIQRVSLGGPVFDLDKLTWMNQGYMHKLGDDAFVGFVRDQIFSPAYLRKLKPIVLERMGRFEEFVDKNDFFFNGALDYSGVKLVPKGRDAVEVKKMLKLLVERLDDLYLWETPNLEGLLKSFQAEVEWKPRDFFMTIRLVVTGRKDSPPLYETMEALGREMTRFRVRNAIKSGHI